MSPVRWPRWRRGARPSQVDAIIPAAGATTHVQPVDLRPPRGRLAPASRHGAASLADGYHPTGTKRVGLGRVTSGCLGQWDGPAGATARGLYHFVAPADGPAGAP